MTRWTSAALWMLASGIAGFSGMTHADDLRAFPVTALRGSLEVVTPPDVVLDGNAARLSIGARIRNQRNLLVTSATLADGTDHAVNYVCNSAGELTEVWLLSDAEAAIPRATAAGAPWYRRMLGL